MFKIYEGGFNGQKLYEGNKFIGKLPQMIYAKQSKIEIEFISHIKHNSIGWNITFSTSLLFLFD